MKQTISATIDKSLVKWIDEQLEDSAKYRNKSHLIEVAIGMLKEKEEK